MKRHLQLVFVGFLVFVLSCEKVKTKPGFIAPIDPIEAVKKEGVERDLTIRDSDAAPKKPEYYFVNAKAGLNYRDAPEGKVLGAFPLNTELKVVEHSRVLGQTYENGQLRQGEWLGIEKESDIVYVFSDFLSKYFLSSELEIYYAHPLYYDGNRIEKGFINLSDGYYSRYDEYIPPLLYYEQRTKGTIFLSDHQKKLFLDRMGFSNRDKVFLYNIVHDSVYSFDVANLSLVAYLSIYDGGRDSMTDDVFDRFDYELGFDLDEKYKLTGETFVYVGQSNPFQTGKMKPVVWREIDQKSFPKKFSANAIGSGYSRSWFDDYRITSSHKFLGEGLTYYVQEISALDSNELARYLVVIDAKTESVIFEHIYVSSESVYFFPLTTEKQEYIDQGQWVGELFENKPAVVYGFIGNSFGCSAIRFVSNVEPAIPILCDNRH